MVLIIDSHEDIAYNIATFGRHYERSAYETRQLEQGSLAPTVNGETMLGWPEYQAGSVAIVFGTLFASPARASKAEWNTERYNNPYEAFSLYAKQADIYARLTDEQPEKFRLIRNAPELSAHMQAWQTRSDENPVPVGIVQLMEGAEAVRKIDDLWFWWEAGVRIIGLAWRSNRFCGGTPEPGPLTEDGRKLLRGMADFGYILDISHMDEQSVLPALDLYPHRIIASHANASALINGYQGNRHLSDEVIKKLVQREGIIGIIPFNHFLDREWMDNGGRQALSLNKVVDHIDHICQLAGDAAHVGIGTDFDGGFGLSSTPFELDSIADLQKLVPLLEARGYGGADIEGILGLNWLHMLEYELR